LAGYGDDAFIKVFYEKLGKSYMQAHEGGLRSFLVSIRESIPGHLDRVDEARKIFNGRNKAGDQIAAYRLEDPGPAGE
jgi:hypothetical protein